MSISDNDFKILWGRAAGRCSNPVCDEELTVILGGRGSFNFGEMAHVIARSPVGPRGTSGGGSDSYENLILLCPTCHTKIDKSLAGTYPEGMLLNWKQQHEARIREVGSQVIFDSLNALKNYISPILLQNRTLWNFLGPRSDPAQGDPGSNLHDVWTFRKLDTIVPNNKRIIRAIDCNIRLLDSECIHIYELFNVHASAFERHCYNRLDDYPLFPTQFHDLFVT